MNSKKIILYIGGFELPDKNAAAQRVISNGKLLADLNYDVFYLGTQNTDDPKIEDKKMSFGGFTYWNLKYPQNIIEWYRYITDVTKIVDVIEHRLPALPYAVIAYDYPSISLAKLLTYCRKNQILLIGDTTDWYKPYQGNLLFRAMKSFDTSFRMRWLHNRMDGMITVSRYLYNYYEGHSANILFLPPLVDASDKKWEYTTQSSSDERSLVYAGQPFSKGSGKKDRIDKVILALSEMLKIKSANIKLYVIGITKEYYLENFGIDMLPDNIIDKVDFLGRISHQKVLSAVQSADYSIFLRDDYRVTRAGFPTKFVESITCGTPVLTNSSSNIGEFMIEQQYGFLLDTSTQKNLVNSLLIAITQPNENITQMKQFCKNSQLFDYRKFIRVTDDFFNKLAPIQ